MAGGAVVVVANAWRPRYTTPRDARVSPAVAAPAPVAAAEPAAAAGAAAEPAAAAEATMAVTTIAAEVTALVVGILRRIAHSPSGVVDLGIAGQPPDQGGVPVGEHRSGIGISGHGRRRWGGDRCCDTCGE